MLSSVADDDLGRLVIYLVELLELLADSFLEFNDSRSCSVLCKSVIDRLNRGVADVLRSGEIRLSRTEADNVSSGCPKLFCLVADGKC